MSLPPQQKGTAKRTGKRISFFNEAGAQSQLKEPLQHVDGPYYTLGAQGQEPVHGEPGALPTSEVPTRYLSSVIFSPEKGDQNRGHYQQTVPMKWGHQEQGNANWAQGIPMGTWGQTFPAYLGGVNVDMNTALQSYGSQAFSKSGHEVMQQSKRGQEKQLPNPAEAYRDPAKVRNVEWEQQQQQAAMARHQAQLQAFQQGQKQGAALAQPSSVLQPFQLAFGQQKQQLPSGYYQVFQTNRTMPNLNYSGQPKSQHQLQQPQQLQQQHLQQQQLQQHQQNQHFLDTYYQNAHHHHHLQSQQLASQGLGPQSHQPEPNVQFQQSSLNPDMQKFPAGTRQTETASQQPLPRRSRRLSKESVPPSGEQPGNPFLTPWSQATQGPQASSVSVGAPQNGAPEVRVSNVQEDVQAAPSGVIQSTRRKRRVSQEVNLETLAQKASEMESLPHKVDKEAEDDRARPSVVLSSADGDTTSAKRARDESLVPLVIPVSVPVRQVDRASPGKEQGEAGWGQRSGQQDQAQPEHKASVIVTRRRSLRNSLSESTVQDGEGLKEDEGKGGAKSKRRPRPEPLFIPPKPGTFIAPPVYSNITPYQSHLRSPVRLADNPLTMPPYTPPPILSPVREGSGLYFSTFLSTASNSHAAPPPITPKSATRSLLRSNSSDITPPVLPAMGEATPVSIEPRINIGPRYQAEIPEIRDRTAAQRDQHKAELVWCPLQEPEAKPPREESVENLMSLACSSALCGGGTNQELALHCLHEAKGDILEALTLLLLKKPIFSKNHPLGNYHYSGSDRWTSAERRYFNKGITAYKKDFFMVQKLVRTKTVAQCVEFYYTYKKQVKIGRNGTLIYGDSEPAEGKSLQDEMEVNVKSSQRYEPAVRDTAQDEDEDEKRKWVELADKRQGPSPPKVTQALQACENAGEVLVLRSQEAPGEEKKRDRQAPQPLPPAPAPKPRQEPAAADKKKAAPSTVNKGQDQENIFPCKKCGRVFYKVKSRSAHMKSHAEQEKKAAALRQKEADEKAAALAAAAARQNGAQAEESSSEESSEEGEDEDDEDWH
ncbi:EMSA1 protein, partial [Atractosteus spatula]|nr:EMSA1 protein [Atractosteus spatula]